MIKITKCEVCENKQLKKVLDLGNHPLCDDLIPIEDKSTCKEYLIEILFCEECLTAHQINQIPKKTLYTNSYYLLICSNSELEWIKKIERLN